MFTTIGLIAKHGDERVIATLERLVDYLNSAGCEVLFDAESARAVPSFSLPVLERPQLGERCDLVIVVAGDGTFLHAARSLVAHGVPLLGINLGRLGFLADIMPSEMTDRLDEVIAGEYEEDYRILLHATIVRDGKTVFETAALNDIVAHKSNIARLVTFETHIDSRLVNTQRSDGVIVATPTGSTAYALSGGGPILHPNLDAIVLVPICPHTLSSRPLVVAADARVEIRLQRDDARQAQLTCDGQTVLELAPGDRIVIAQLGHRLRLIHPPGHDHYATLRAKLHWAREL